MRVVDLQICGGFFHVFGVKDAFMSGDEDGANVHDRRRLVVATSCGAILSFYDFDKIKEAFNADDDEGQADSDGANLVRQ